jgi:hypothetical protein
MKKRRTYPSTEPSTHRTGVWVSSRASVDVMEIGEGWRTDSADFVNHNSILPLRRGLVPFVLQLLYVLMSMLIRTALWFTVYNATEQDGENGRIANLYPGRIRFESRPGHRLSWPELFVIFLSPSGRVGIVN